MCSATQPAKAAISRIRQLRTRDGTALPILFGFVGMHPEERGVNAGERVQPVPGLTVTTWSNTQEYRTQTAGDGSYEFRELPHGPYRVSVEVPAGRWVFWHAEVLKTDALPGINIGTVFRDSLRTHGDASRARVGLQNEVFY